MPFKTTCALVADSCSVLNACWPKAEPSKSIVDKKVKSAFLLKSKGGTSKDPARSVPRMGKRLQRG
jgi:hypothetical protein